MSEPIVIETLDELKDPKDLEGITEGTFKEFEGSKGGEE